MLFQCANPQTSFWSIKLNVLSCFNIKRVDLNLLMNYKIVPFAERIFELVNLLKNLKALKRFFYWSKQNSRNIRSLCIEIPKMMMTICAVNSVQ